MGLFDKIFQTASEETKLTQQEAFAGIALAMAGADGSIAESEWNGIVNYIRRLKIYDNFSGPAHPDRPGTVRHRWPWWRPPRRSEHRASPAPAVSGQPRPFCPPGV